MSASVNVVINVVSAPATSVTFSPTASSFTAPVAAGTKLGTFAVAPASWNGTLTLSGADASFFTLDTNLDLLVGAAALTAVRAYNVTVTAAP